MPVRPAAIVAAAAVTFGALVVAPTGPTAGAANCGRFTLNADQLDGAFAGPGLGATAAQPGFGGGDYQHAYPLPDGRVLWLFQDLHFSNDDNLFDSVNDAAHNAGLVQQGECFTILGSQGRDYIGDALTQDSRRWFWPLDGEQGADGLLWIFMVEMHNPDGSGAQRPAAPVATWVARINPITLGVVSFTPAPDASADLYGWSVASNDQYSYLYGHCYRQFIDDPSGPGQFDETCMPHTYLARVPVGQFGRIPEYWNGSGWTSSADAAVPVFSRGAVNPMSVQFFGDVWVSVTKIDDWWGTHVHVDRAPSPQGPWATVQTIPVVNDRRCSSGCGNYHAELLPWLDELGRLTIALSNGADFDLWRANAWLYRPSFSSINVPAPAPSGSAATPPAFTSSGAGAGFVPVDPTRLVDTRQPGQPFARLPAGGRATLDLRGRMPAGATAVALNLTSEQSADGWVRAYACDQPEPATSNLNPAAGRVVTNASIVPVGAGVLCFATYAPTELIVDLNGWLTLGSEVGLVSSGSRRLVDTRIGMGGTRLAAGNTLSVPAASSGATTGVALSVTAVDPSENGFVTAYPCGQPLPVVSNLNPQAGVIRPNLVNVRAGTGGAVCLYSSGHTDLVVDLLAEYRQGSGARYIPVSPTRLLDTRQAGHHSHPSNWADIVALGSPVAAQVNLVATETTAAGFLTAYPCLTSRWPGTSNANFAAGETVAAAALLGSSRGYGCVYSYLPAHVVVDIFGVWR